MGIVTILWEKWREFIRDFSRITLAAMVAPLMYLIVFGWGIRNTMNGQPYLYFLIPGVVSLTTMNGSFNAIAQNLNVQRLYEKAFDQVIISPTPLWQFVAGQILAGALRGLYAGGIILFLILPVGTGLKFNAVSILIFKRSRLFLRRNRGFLSGKKPCGCAPVFQLYNYAHGISVQHLLLHGADSPRGPGAHSNPAPVADKPHGAQHFRGRTGQALWNPGLTGLSYGIYGHWPLFRI